MSLNALLKSFLGFCESEGSLNQSPYYAITLKNALEAKAIEPFSLEEVKTLIKNAPSLRLKAFLAVAFFTGLRTGEQLALLWSDVDFENKKINIDKSLNLSGTITDPKNKPSIREVDLLDPLMLAKIKEHQAKTDYINETSGKIDLKKYQSLAEGL
ncbi:hypothetical protein BTM182_15110 [Helicobacter pylori]